MMEAADSLKLDDFATLWRMRCPVVWRVLG